MLNKGKKGPEILRQKEKVFQSRGGAPSPYKAAKRHKAKQEPEQKEGGKMGK